MSSCFPVGIRYHSADMKQFIFSTLAIAGLFAFISCERHNWEDKDGDKGTKRLFPKEEKKDKGSHGHKGHDGHDDHH